MKTTKLLLTLTFSFIFSFLTFSQEQGSFSYISPLPGSKYINPEQTIALRHGDVIVASSVRNSLITVRGSHRGEITGSVKLSVDGRTLIFTPDKPFSLKEKISVEVSGGIRTETGVELEGLSLEFEIKPLDNYPLLKEYYQEEHKKETEQYNEQVKEEKSNTGSRDNQDYPENYPVATVTEYDNPTPGYTFVTPNGFRSAPYGNYNVIIDNYGIPVYFRDWHESSRDFKMVPGNRMASSEHSRRDPVINKYLVYNSHFEIEDTLMMGNGYYVDAHDMLLLENGNYFMMAYDPQPVDMSQIVPGGDTNATVTGFIIQQLDTEDNVIFQWRSWDHFEITDAPHEDMTSDRIDYVHGNAFELDYDSNLMFSSRHLEEITKIDLNTGDVIWRFGPNATQNMFTFTNDTIGFSHQHDIRRIANGNITIYDNGNYHDPQFSQSLEYEIDEENLIATLVWNYINDPVVYGGATGSTQRLENGNTLIDWGATWPICVTEANYNQEKTWEVEWPYHARHYRALKYNWKTDLFETNLDTIDYGEYDDYVPWPRIISIKNNSDEEIAITSTHNHWDSYSVVTQLPLTIPAGESGNLTVNFYPTMEGHINDVLTLNYDSFVMDTLPRRISRQVYLTGYVPDDIEPQTTITPTDGSVEVAQDSKIVISFNEPVTHSDGSAIKYTDLDDIIRFNIVDGEDVEYSATVNAWKTKITLTPDTLYPMTNYHVEVVANSIADRESNFVAEAQVSEFTTVDDQGIGEDAHESILVFPNPATGKIHIDLKGKSAVSVKVLDINGRKIASLHKITGNKFTFDLEPRPAGIYFVEILFEDGQFSTVKVLKN